jgi:hypothetical protein
MRKSERGQSLVEFALIVPLFTVVLSGIITLGIGVFYQQQLTNAAREAARYAAIHSATSQCPTTSWLLPNLSRLPDDFDLGNYYDCDPASKHWPEMTQHGRDRIFGMDKSGVTFSACWSGYWENSPSGWDAAPRALDGTANQFHDCTIAGVDARANASGVACPAPATTAADDQASDLAASDAGSANQVTVYACYQWHPPVLSDLIGSTITMRAVVTEAMQHQQ